MKTHKKSPTPIPTTRKWYKPFREIMNEKVARLQEVTWKHRVWGYDENKSIPFGLWQDNNFDAAFGTDGELFECVYWMLWGLSFNH